MQHLIFSVVILIMSVVIHEVSHGYVANILGDPTARLQGRLTLNPIKHLDLFGSIIIPGILILTGSPYLIGWAKPVPYNPYNLGAGKWGPAIVALAGPGVNILIALIFTVVLRMGVLVEISAIIVFINLILAMFNLIPVPPLDGSKLLSSLLSGRQYASFARYEAFLSQYGLIFIFIFIFIFSRPFFGFVFYIFQLLTGSGLPL